jgi:hypothetical protein
MAVVSSVLCDRCGAEILEARTVLDIVTGPLVKVLDPAQESGRPRIDLCSSCCEAFRRWLQSVSAPVQ